MTNPGSNISREILFYSAGFLAAAAGMATLSMWAGAATAQWTSGVAFLAGLLLGHRLHYWFTRPADHRVGIVRPWFYYLVQAAAFIAIYCGLSLWLVPSLMSGPTPAPHTRDAASLAVTGLLSFIPALVARPLVGRREDHTADGLRLSGKDRSAGQGLSLLIHYIADLTAFGSVALLVPAAADAMQIELSVWFAAFGIVAALLASAILDEGVVRLVDYPAGRVRRYGYRGTHAAVLLLVYAVVTWVLFPQGAQDFAPYDHFLRASLIPTGLAAFLPFLAGNTPTLGIRTDA